MLPSFKQILIDSSNEYVNTTDKGRDKARTTLISRVAAEIRNTIDGTVETVPTDLRKVQFMSSFYYSSNSDIYRLSARGSEMRQDDTPRVTVVRRRRMKIWAIRLLQNPGPQSPCVARYILNG